eukprot:g25749.t1
MSPTLFFVSFSLVFRTVPCAFLSCRVLKQDYPTCVANDQATSQHSPQVPESILIALISKFRVCSPAQSV